MEQITFKVDGAGIFGVEIFAGFRVYPLKSVERSEVRKLNLKLGENLQLFVLIY